MTNHYATFWLRVAAFLIDTLLIVLLFYIFKDSLPESISLYWINILFSWFYFALFHSSSWKATIGKKLVAIQVVDYVGEQINFKQASIRFFAGLISATLLLPYLTVIFTKRKQAIHDMLAKTIVVEEGSLLYSKNYNKLEEDKEVKIITTKRKIVYVFLTLFTGALLYLLYPVILLFIMFSYMYIEKESSYNKSFHTVYQEKDYNDSRIDFYKNELEKSARGFVNAKGIIDVFEYDTKVDLSLECIEYYMKEHNETNRIKEGIKFRNNARNKFAINDDLIKDAKDNEDSMGGNLYLYDRHLVNDIKRDITNLWHKKSKKSLCKQNFTVDQLYDVFLTNYLAKYIDNHISSKERKLSASDNRKFLEYKHKSEKEWLALITKKSPLDIYKQFSQGKITLEDIAKYNNFKASIYTYDVVFYNDKFIIADKNRGLELWNVDSKGKAVFEKTLTDEYKVYRVKKVNNLLFVAASGKRRGTFFIIFSYDEKTKSIKELSKIQLGLYSIIHDWRFFDNYNKVAVVSGYDKMTILDISKPEKINIIRKKIDRTNNFSSDISINEITNKLYEMTRHSLNIFDIKDDLVSRVNSDYSFKGHQGLVVNKEDNTLYTLHITWEKDSYLFKYTLDNPYKPKLISSKSLDINFEGWNGGSFPENMRIYENKIYIATKHFIHIFDTEMNKIGKIYTPDIKQFHFLENKIIYTRGKNGLSFVK